MIHFNKIVVLVANYGYIDKVTATIKSLLANNDNVKIYLFNSDIPQEYFKFLNQQINCIGSMIQDIKIDPAALSKVQNNQQRITNIAYARFMIPDLVPEDKVVYLDSDIIIDGDISKLFAVQFAEGEWAAACKEIESFWEHQSGVVVFNNRLLKQKAGLSAELLEMGTNKDLRNGDQTVFSSYFKGHIQELPQTYNYEIGQERWAEYQNRTDMLTKLAEVKDPLVIHYNNEGKPWDLTSSSHKREVWWHYYTMSWEVIQWLSRSRQEPVPVSTMTKCVGETITFTNDQNLEQVETLVKRLPQWHFNIGAPVFVGWELKKLIQYQNVTIYPMILPSRYRSLVQSCDVYLDINYGPKDVGKMDQFVKTGKPVLAFEETKTADETAANYLVYQKDQVEQMIQYLADLAKSAANSK